jgi:hypothetical protein
VALSRDGAVRDAALKSTRQLAPGVVVPDDQRRAAALVDSLGRLDFPRSGARVGADGRLAVPATSPRR